MEENDNITDEQQEAQTEATETPHEQTATPVPAPTPVPAKWYDSLEDEGLKTNPNITKHKDVAGLAKAYVEATKKLGQKGFTPLPADATAEQRAAYNAIRRGESIKTPDDYSWGKGTAHEADEGVKMLKQVLFNAGADEYMASEVLSAISNADDVAGAEQMAHAQKVYEGEAEKLRSEWGENFAVNLKANDILLNKYPEAAQIIRNLGLEKMSSFQLMLHNLSKLASDGQIQFEKAREVGIEERIDEITKSEAYRQTWHPEHESAKRQRAELILELVRKGKN